jgi:hypothetical protein
MNIIYFPDDIVKQEMLKWFIKYYKFYLLEGQQCSDVKILIESATGKTIDEVMKDE